MVAPASDAASSHTMTNSSPPYRATESPARATDRSREATSTSTSSPTRWPRLSLIALKPSRSRNTTESGRPLREAAAMAASRRSSSSLRLASPVSWSCSARCSSSSWRRTRRSTWPAWRARAAWISRLSSSNSRSRPKSETTTPRVRSSVRSGAMLNAASRWRCRASSRPGMIAAAWSRLATVTISPLPIACSARPRSPAESSARVVSSPATSSSGAEASASSTAAARCAKGGAGARDEGRGQLLGGGGDAERARRVLEHAHACLGCLGVAPREQQLPLVVLALRRVEDGGADAGGLAVRHRSPRPH